MQGVRIRTKDKGLRLRVQNLWVRIEKRDDSREGCAYALNP